MSDPSSSSPPRSAGWSAAWIVAALLGLLFGPLGLSILETVLFHTSHVEELCRHLGIHGALSRIYKPLVELIAYLLRFFQHR